MIPCSNDFITAMSTPVKEVFLKMEIYTSDMKYIDEISKNLTISDAGNVSVDRTRPVRRSFSFSLSNLDGKYTWNENSLIWIDKKIKLFIGLKLRNGTIEYIPQGVYCLATPQDEHTVNSNKVTLSGYDKAYLFTGNRGKFDTDQSYATGLKVTTAIQTIAAQGGETLFLFDDITDTLPYTFTYTSSSNRWNAMQDLATLAKSEIYYDVNGYLKLKKLSDINDLQNYSSVWNFSVGDNFYAGNVRKMDDTNLYNNFIAVGGGTQTATVRDEITVSSSNPIWANSPYTIEKIGKITYFHNSGNADPVLITQADCHYRNKYNLMQYLGYSEIVDMSITPHYLLEPNDVIDIEDATNNLTGRHLINKIDIPLNPSIITMEVLKQNNVVSDWNLI